MVCTKLGNWLWYVFCILFMKVLESTLFIFFKKEAWGYNRHCQICLCEPNFMKINWVAQLKQLLCCSGQFYGSGNTGGYVSRKVCSLLYQPGPVLTWFAQSMVLLKWKGPISPGLYSLLISVLAKFSHCFNWYLIKFSFIP